LFLKQRTPVNGPVPLQAVILEEQIKDLACTSAPQGSGARGGRRKAASAHSISPEVRWHKYLWYPHDK
jgi:hypothetical protein